MTSLDLPFLVPYNDVTEQASVTGQELASLRLSRLPVFTLPVEKLHPVIRIAHRNILQEMRERIIRDFELVQIIAGAGKLILGKQSLDFSEGDIICIPPFVRHRFFHKDLSEHIAIHFDLAPNFPTSSADLSRRKPCQVRLTKGLVLPRHVVPQADSAIVAMFPEIVAHFLRKDPLSRARAQALLLGVITSILSAAAASAGPSSLELVAGQQIDARLNRCLDYLEKHFAEPITPGDVARATGLSEGHLSRLFRKWTASSLGEYVTRRRIAEARRLLSKSDLRINEIAALCGFQDYGYFSRVFKQIDGRPPTEFRDLCLGQNRAK